MAIVLQQFSKGSLTVAQLNALVTAIESKFAGGITGSDMAWPLEAQGNVDMGHFEFLNVAEFWKVRNLAERDVGGGTSVQDVFDAVNSAGGGSIYLAGDSVEIIGSAGITVGANTLVFGAGASSVFAAAVTMSNSMFRSRADDLNGIEFYNLRFDGTSVGSGAHPAIEFIQADDGRVVNCEFEGFLGPHVTIGTDNTGFPSEYVTLSKCRFLTPISGTSNPQVLFGEASRCLITECDFILPRAGCIDSGSIQSRDNVIVDCKFQGSAINGTAAIVLTAGVSATSTEDTKVLNCTFDGGSADSQMRVLISGHNDSVVSGNTFRDGTGKHPAISILAGNGHIVSNNTVHDWSGDGITISVDNSTDAGTNVQGATNIGILHNSIQVSAEPILIHVPAITNSILALRIIANYVSGVRGIVFWNLPGGPPTTHNFGGTIVANNVCDCITGVICYSDAGVTRGGQIGASANSNFILGGNETPNTLIGANVTDDFDSTPADTKLQTYGNIV